MFLAKAHLLCSQAFGHKKKKKGNYGIREGSFGKGEQGVARGGKKEKILWVETPKGKSLLGNRCLALKKKKKI